MIRRSTPLVVLAFVLVTAQVCLAGPILRTSESEFDFGLVPQHYDVSHTIWLYSKGDEDLKILKFEPDCACLKSNLKGHWTIPPGDSLPLEITFNSHRFTYRVNKSPNIYTNEGLERFGLKISATVAMVPEKTEPIVVRPFFLDMSPIGERSRQEMSFYLENKSDQALRPHLVSQADLIESVELPDVIGPGATAAGKVKLKTAALGTNFDKSFTIELDDRESTRYTVPVKRRIH
jgi:hypothetical protein